MMNVAMGTSLTGCWLKQASGQGYGQADRQRLARRLVEVALDDPRRLTRAPLVMMCMQLEAIALQELEIARGIYNNHTKELDDVNLGHVEKFKGTVRNAMRKAIKEFIDEANH